MITKPGIYRDITEMLGVHVVEHDVKAFERLPGFESLPGCHGPFDVVTGFMVCFNGHRTDHLWKVSEWSFFLDDITARMSPGGVICLELNRELEAVYEHLFRARVRADEILGAR